MGIHDPLTLPAESQLRQGNDAPLLLQLRSDRRLGHEWDDWDGDPLPGQGVFREREAVFFHVALLAGLGGAALALLASWLLGPRLAMFWGPLALLSAGIVIAAFLLWLAWLGAIALVLRTSRNWLPLRLAEGGLLPWVMPRLERLGGRLGYSRDRVGNALVRVFNRLTSARSRDTASPEEILILLPRCLGKESMQAAMEVSSRYGVPLFVAARGRYARQMIALRQPKRVVAVACERDLVSGVHDVAGHLPVLGTTLGLADGPCRNTTFRPDELEEQVRMLLGISTGIVK